MSYLFRDDQESVSRLDKQFQGKSPWMEYDFRTKLFFWKENHFIYNEREYRYHSKTLREKQHFPTHVIADTWSQKKKTDVGVSFALLPLELCLILQLCLCCHDAQTLQSKKQKQGETNYHSIVTLKFNTSRPYVLLKRHQNTWCNVNCLSFCAHF